MKGELYINGKDAWTTWGVTLSYDSMAELMKPAPMKKFVENASGVLHGVQVLTTKVVEGITIPTARIDERNVTITITLSATNRELFYSRYRNFTEELQKGFLSFKVSRLKTTYNLIYEDCQQFRTFLMGKGRFILRLREPDPTNRIFE